MMPFTTIPPRVAIAIGLDIAWHLATLPGRKVLAPIWRWWITR